MNVFNDVAIYRGTSGRHGDLPLLSRSSSVSLCGVCEAGDCCFGVLMQRPKLKEHSIRAVCCTRETEAVMIAVQEVKSSKKS